MSKTHTWAAAFGLAASVTSTAWATTDYKLKDDSTFTQASGATSVHYEWIHPPTGDYQGMYEITMWEKENRPCRIRGRSRHVNTYSGRSFEYNDCGASGNAEKALSFSQQDTYITGIQVCLNRAGDSIKGLKVFGKQLNRASGALSDAGSKKFERPNCKDWKVIRHCPAGKVAVGMTFYRSAGIALQCRTLEKK